MKAALKKAFYRLSESSPLRVNYRACRSAQYTTGDPHDMAQVHPFQAFRYNPQRVPFERVLTQPYDKISPAMQDNYYAADPHNLISVEKGRAFPDDTPQNNVYTRAAAASKIGFAKTLSRKIPSHLFTPTRRNTPSPEPASSAHAAVSSAPENSRTIPPASSFATSTHSPVPKPTASNFSATRARTPASSSCSIRIPSSASTRF